MDMNTQLRLSSTNRMVGGVAGGLAETYGWDPTLVRVGFVALTLLNGIGLLLYGALWLVMRYGIASSLSTGTTGTELGPVSDRNRMLGLVLIAVGMLVLASIFDVGIPMMAVLLIGGGWYLMRRS
jgi:phage shock protein C